MILELFATVFLFFMNLTLDLVCAAFGICSLAGIWRIPGFLSALSHGGRGSKRLACFGNFFIVLSDIPTIMVGITSLFPTRIYKALPEFFGELSNDNGDMKYASGARAVLWKHFFLFIWDIICIPPGLIALCTWRLPKVWTCFVDTGKNDFEHRMQLLGQFFMLLLNIPAYISAAICLCSWRCVKVYRLIREINEELELNVVLIGQFFALILNIPCYFCGLVALVTWRLPRVWADIRDDDLNEAVFNLRLIMHAVMVFLDLPAFAAAAVCLVSWRMKKIWKVINEKAEDFGDEIAKDFKMLRELLFLILNIPAFVCALFCMVTWRAFIVGPVLKEAVQSETSTPGEEFLFMMYMFFNVIMIPVNVPFIIMGLVLLVSWHAKDMWKTLTQPGKKWSEKEAISDTIGLFILYMLEWMIVPFALVVLVTGFRAGSLFNLIKKIGAKESRGEEAAVSFLLLFVITILEIPLAILALINLLSVWKTKRMYEAIKESNDNNAGPFRKGAIWHFMLLVRDIIFCLPPLLVLLVTVKRFSSFLARYRASGSHVEKRHVRLFRSVWSEFFQLVVDLTMAIIAGWLFLLPWRGLPLIYLLAEHVDKFPKRKAIKMVQLLRPAVLELIRLRKVHESQLNDALKPGSNGVTLTASHSYRYATLDKDDSNGDNRISWVSSRRNNTEFWKPLDETMNKINGRFGQILSDCNPELGTKVAELTTKASAAIDKQVVVYRNHGAFANGSLSPAPYMVNITSAQQLLDETTAHEQQVLKEMDEYEKATQQELSKISMCPFGFFARSSETTREIVLSMLFGAFKDFAAVISFICVTATLYRLPVLLIAIKNEKFDRRDVCMRMFREIFVDILYLFRAAFILIGLYHGLDYALDVLDELFGRRSVDGARRVTRHYVRKTVDDLAKLLSFFGVWKTYKTAMALAFWGFLSPAELYASLFTNNPGCCSVWFAFVVWFAFAIFPFIIVYRIAPDSITTTHAEGSIGAAIGFFLILLFLITLIGIFTKTRRASQEMRNKEAMQESRVANNMDIQPPAPRFYATWPNIIAALSLFLEFYQLLSFAFIQELPLPEGWSRGTQTASGVSFLAFPKFTWESQFWGVFSLVGLWYLVSSAPAVLEQVLKSRQTGDIAKNQAWRYLCQILSTSLFTLILVNLLKPLGCEYGNGTAHMLADTTVSCWSDRSHKAAALLGLLGLGFYVPTACIAGSRFWATKPVDNLDASTNVNFEAFLAILKSLLSTTTIFFAGRSTATLGIALAVCLGFLVFTLVFKKATGFQPDAIPAFTAWRCAAYAGAAWAAIAGLVAVHQNSTTSYLPLNLLIIGWGVILLITVFVSLSLRPKEYEQSLVTVEQVRRRLLEMDAEMKESSLSFVWVTTQRAAWRRAVAGCVRPQSFAKLLLEFESALYTAQLRPEWAQKSREDWTRCTALCGNLNHVVFFALELHGAIKSEAWIRPYAMELSAEENQLKQRVDEERKRGARFRAYEDQTGLSGVRVIGGGHLRSLDPVAYESNSYSSNNDEGSSSASSPNGNDSPYFNSNVYTPPNYSSGSIPPPPPLPSITPSVARPALSMSALNAMKPTRNIPSTPIGSAANSPSPLESVKLVDVAEAWLKDQPFNRFTSQVPEGARPQVSETTDEFTGLFHFKSFPIITSSSGQYLPFGWKLTASAGRVFVDLTNIVLGPARNMHSAANMFDITLAGSAIPVPPLTSENSGIALYIEFVCRSEDIDNEGHLSSLRVDAKSSEENGAVFSRLPRLDKLIKSSELTVVSKAKTDKYHDSRFSYTHPSAVIARQVFSLSHLAGSTADIRLNLMGGRVNITELSIHEVSDQAPALVSPSGSSANGSAPYASAPYASASASPSSDEFNLPAMIAAAKMEERNKVRRSSFS